MRLSRQPLCACVCVHVRARCPHLTAHLRAEPCQTTNQAIHHLSTCRPPLRVRRRRAHACQELVFIGVRKRRFFGSWTINKLISGKVSSRVLVHQGQSCTQARQHMLTELGCDYPQAKTFTPDVFTGVESHPFCQKEGKGSSVLASCSPLAAGR